MRSENVCDMINSDWSGLKRIQHILTDGEHRTANIVNMKTKLSPSRYHLKFCSVLK